MRCAVRHRTASIGVAFAAAGALALAQWPVSAEQETPTAAVTATARPCRIRGLITGDEMPLPGVSLTLHQGDHVVGASSTDVDGTYLIAVAPGTYSIAIELAAFATVQREVTLGAPPCEATLDAALALVSRVPGGVTSTPTAPPPQVAAGAPGAAAGPGGGRGFGGGRFGGGGGRFGGANRFQSLSVEQSTGAATAPDTAADVVTTSIADDPAARLLPPGFSLNAPEESVTVNGTQVELDRGQLGDRIQALARGEFGLADGQQPTGPLQGLLGQTGGFGGGPGGGRGGFGGPGLGGRGLGAGRTQVSATYGLGGSMFDAAPYALGGQATTKPDYLQQNFSTTVGGALKIPHVYDGTNRTTYNFSYSGSHNNNVFDQYATVPSDAYRAGDFSASTAPIIDPLTGQPFPGNQIPQDRMSAAALALLRYIPEPNLPGDARNFHISNTTLSTTDQFSLRITHSLTKPQAGRGGRGGFGRGGAGRGGGGQAPGGGAGSAGGQAGGGTGTPAAPGTPAGGPGGRGGRGAFQPPLNVTINGTINYRRNSGDRSNVFPLLAGTTTGATFSAPVTLNIRAGRSIHAISTTFSRTRVDDAQQLRVRPGHHRPGGHHGRRDRSVRLGRPVALVRVVHGAPRHGAVATGRPLLAGQLRLDAAVRLTHLPAWAARTSSRSAARSRTRTPAARSRSPVSTRRVETRRCAAAARTSRTSCSACRSRPRGSTAQTPDNIGQAVSIRRPQLQRVPPGRLALEGALDDQLRRAVRLRGAVHRDERPHGESRRRAGLQAVATVTPGATGPVLRDVSGRARQARLEQRRAASRRGVAGDNRSVRAVRLRPELQQRARTRRLRGTCTSNRRSSRRAPSLGSLAAPLALTDAFVEHLGRARSPTATASTRTTSSG